MTPAHHEPAEEWTALPDLASRALAGSVMYANDEFFAEKENLILPGDPVFDPDEFGHKGKVYDGWETRRRRGPGGAGDGETSSGEATGEDVAIVRLGVPGRVHGVVVDTAFFRGNYPPEVAVDGVRVDGHPPVGQLLDAPWRPLVGVSAVRGDARNPFHVEPEARVPVTHVRLRILPDGGVARLRVHGVPTPDPRFLAGTIDLAAAENGGRVTDCSDLFYSSPSNIIAPGRSRLMGEGWENARRRGEGNDHVTVALAGEGTVDRVEIDTSYYIGNAPGAASLRGIRCAGDLDSPERWIDLVPRTHMLPDCRHHFVVDTVEPVRFVRLDVFPDGGIARLRVHGRLTDAAMVELAERAASH